MLATRQDVDDFVVDVVLELEPGGTGADEVRRRLHVPGTPVSCTSAGSTIWVTTVLPAARAQAAVQEVADHLLSAIPDAQEVRATAAVRCLPWGELLSQLDPALDDPELECLDVVDLVADTLWNPERGPSAPTVLDMCAGRVAHSA